LEHPAPDQSASRRPTQLSRVLALVRRPHPSPPRQRNGRRPRARRGVLSGLPGRLPAPMRILSFAALRGPGLESLRLLGELSSDPWNEYVPIKLHSADDLIARAAGFDVLIVEADHVPARLF